MSSELTWITTDEKTALLPKWLRSAAVDAEGVVYVPAAIAGGETDTLLAASWDGNVALVYDAGHAYLPARWIAREYPDIAEVCLLIEKKCRAHLAKEPAP